ncbi:MAG: NAD(P)-binding domain-containing protein [Sphingomonadales bacterium]|nr:NAD(P)-binding domain-containing protein [Sphingomonadales bacterium]
MKIAIIGAGPAGITSARQALVRGHDIIVFERHTSVGGIWNPASGGAYPGVKMQSSKLSFPFSDFAPISNNDFLSLDEVHDYLSAYSKHFDIEPHIRFQCPVTHMAKEGGQWRLESPHGTDYFDAVMVASGELWVPQKLVQAEASNSKILTAKDYRGPDDFIGKKILVIGGGVSGADIASELGEAGHMVHWSVRRKALFLPRFCGRHYNDALFSYAGRLSIDEMSYDDYIRLLEQIAPDHIAACRRSNMMPDPGFPNAVHVNDKIVNAVEKGLVSLRPATQFLDASAEVVFADDKVEKYDRIIQCIGYGWPDYSFIEGFDRKHLYEHFIYWPDPSLAIINTPVDTEAFGTACPYFEAIAGWALRVFDGSFVLPPEAEMARWSDQNMSALRNKRFYDCWLETIRLSLMNRTIADPQTEFAHYWTLISGNVQPARLASKTPSKAPCAFDDLAKLADIRIRILASLPPKARAGLVATGQISQGDETRASQVPESKWIEPMLPYRMRMEQTVSVKDEVQMPMDTAAQ